MSLNTTPDSYTKLLIHSDTSDGSTTFVDSSANGHTLSNNGNSHHEVDQYKFGTTSMQFRIYISFSKTTALSIVWL